MRRPAPSEREPFVPVVLGLGGSTRRSSRTVSALRVALDGAARAGAETSLLDVGSLALPILDADADDSRDGGVRTLLDAVRRAHALIVATPVYQETISGAVKNMLDHLSPLEHEVPPALSGRVVGVISVSGNLAGMGASTPVRAACRALQAWVLPDSVDLGGTSFDADDRVCDMRARDLLLTLGRRVAHGAVARRAQDRVPSAAEVLRADGDRP